jgi:hypothetical protein
MPFLKRLHPALFLLVFAFLAYGIFFWQRGFYWDEAPWTWIYFRLGADALTKTFSTSRPFWGMIYQVTLPLVGANPWAWQLIAIILRWLSAVLVWLIVREWFPQNDRPALWTSILFLVYPGLSQNFIALMYAHFFLILNCFLLSLYLSFKTLQTDRWKIPLLIASLILAFINLITMEYFYFLEFARAALFWFVLRADPKRGRNTILNFSPFLLLFAGITVWRVFFFANQNASYGYSLFAALKQNPLLGVWSLAQHVIASFWETVPHAWLSAFSIVDPSLLGWRTGILIVMVVIAALLLSAVTFRKPESESQIWIKPAFAMGAIMWLCAGGSFWLVGLEPKLIFHADRFTMPFMFGASLILAATIGLFSARPFFQNGLLALIIAFSVGKQAQTSLRYQHDWETQQTFFHQLHWRAPALAKGTTLITNDLPLTYYSDNSLSGFLNWIYSPPGKMDTILYFASVRTQAGRALDSGLGTNQIFEQNYLATTFTGNTSRIIAINFDPPRCVRILDPEIDPLNKLIDPTLRDVARYSDRNLIHAEGGSDLPDQLFGAEPDHGWCYYFELADRSRGDWARIAALGDQAFALDDHPNDPVERFIFIEAYAHTENWKSALKQTKEAYRFSKAVMRPMLCALWNRVERDLEARSDSAGMIDQARAEIQCP